MKADLEEWEDRLDEARTAVRQYCGVGGSAHLESLRRSYFEAMKTIGKLHEEMSRAVRDAGSRGTNARGRKYIPGHSLAARKKR